MDRRQVLKVAAGAAVVAAAGQTAVQQIIRESRVTRMPQMSSQREPEFARVPKEAYAALVDAVTPFVPDAEDDAR